jgi:hypothetical protein
MEWSSLMQPRLRGRAVAAALASSLGRRCSAKLRWLFVFAAGSTLHARRNLTPSLNRV